jgi:hypothetical protein
MRHSGNDQRAQQRSIDSYLIFVPSPDYYKKI